MAKQLTPTSKSRSWSAARAQLFMCVHSLQRTAGAVAAITALLQNTFLFDRWVYEKVR